jgi:hypothetical protein
MAGHPHSESLRVIERFHRVDFGHIEFQITFYDPETFTKPLSINEVINYQADTEMLEGVCENERDTPHLVGEANAGMKLSAGLLAQYAGTYEPREGPRGVPRQPFTIRLADGQLYLGPLPLTPQSETSFLWHDGTSLEFSRDATGAVTGVTRTFAEGQTGLPQTLKSS